MTTSNMTAGQSAVAIDKVINLISGNLKRYREYTKDAVVAIIRHTIDFGDCNKAKDLLRAVNPKDKTALIEYFRLYSPIRVSLGKTKADDKTRLCHADKATYTPFDLDGAIAQTEWWNLGKITVEKDLKVVAEFFDAVAKAVKPSDKVLEGYSEASREEIADISKDLSVLIERYRMARLAAKAAMTPGAAPAEHPAEQMRLAG